jgi:superfamily I DNA/RNA helicase
VSQDRFEVGSLLEARGRAQPAGKRAVRGARGRGACSIRGALSGRSPPSGIALEVPQAVGLYTIFGAKGQQWDHVFPVGAYSQGFTGRAALAEGLRLLYVALTRTKVSLTVTYPRGIRYTQLAQRQRPQLLVRRAASQ